MKKEDLKEIRELLVVIDMVNGFVKEGTLAAPTIMRIVPRIEKLMDYYINKVGGCVAVVRDSHTKDAVEFNTYPAHCIEGSKESELIEELKKYENDSLTYLKNSTNLVFAKGFIDDLRKMINLQKIIFTGCLSEVCVENGAISTKNLLDEWDRNVEVWVDALGIDTYDAPGHDRDLITKEALLRMERNGVKIYKKGNM